jgi:hypothetical protein
MRHATTLLVLTGLAAVCTVRPEPAGAQAAAAKTHSVTITLAQDDASKKCSVSSVSPDALDPEYRGDTIEWTASGPAGKCAQKAVKISKIVVKATGAKKSPLKADCSKRMTVGGAALRCVVDPSAEATTYKYDLEIDGNTKDPEIRVRG